MSLDRLLGTWTSSMRHHAVPEPVAGEHTFERILTGAYVLQRSTYQHPEFPDALAVLDDSSCHYFDVRGVTRVFDLACDDDGWTMVRRNPDFWQRSTVGFDGAAAMRGMGENSFDGGVTWTHDYAISYARVR